jgi:hypothetical protein
MSVLNLACVLLGTISGFGAVANLLSIPALRCYDRLSIVIMFLALVPVCLLLAAIERRAGNRAWARGAYVGLLVAMLVCGVWEQSRYFRNMDRATLNTFRSDRAFVKAIEVAVGPDAAVFQYPVQNFLSNRGPALAIDPYTHFRGFMHSRTLTWSMGAVVGRRGATIHSAIEAQPITKQVESLALIGFDGIYVDRKLYADGGEALERELRALTEAEPIVSDNKRLAFYPTARYTAALRKRLTPDEWRMAREEVLTPVTFALANFDSEEQHPAERYAWCKSQTGRMRVGNPKGRPVTMEIKYSFAAANNRPATLRVKGPSFNETRSMGPHASPMITHRIIVPPGEHEIEFWTDAEPVTVPTWTAVFRLREVEVRVADTQQMALRTDGTVL